MRGHLVAGLTIVLALPALSGCASLGHQSTVTELAARCDARGGELVPAGTAAVGGLGCRGSTANAAATSVSTGASARTAQLNAAISRSLTRGY